jgi:hypothetical protein
MIRKIVIILLIIAFAIGSYFVFFGSSGEPINRDNLNQHGKLAIGVFLGRTVEDSKTKTVVYEYLADTVLIQNSDGLCYLDSEKASDHFYFTKYPLLKGNEFVVLYDSLNPEISIIRLDYPLRDSTDFNSYIVEFEKKRMEKEEVH